MRFFALAAAAVLTITGVFASPAITQSNELEARSEDVALDARTFWGCSLLEKIKCGKRQGYYWDSKACCCNPNPTCPSGAKHACLSKGGFYAFNDHPKCECYCDEHTGKSKCAAKGLDFDHSKCACKPKECDAHEKTKCEAAHGTYNSHECKCTYPPPPTCEKEKTECGRHGWGCNNSCQCVPPSHEPCKNWLKALVCYKLGKKCDSNCRCY